MGVNRPQPILRCLEAADSDIRLLASRYSLIDHADAVEQVFPKAREKGAGFVVGSALNANFLGGEPRCNYGDANTPITTSPGRRTSATGWQDRAEDIVHPDATLSG